MLFTLIGQALVGAIFVVVVCIITLSLVLVLPVLAQHFAVIRSTFTLGLVGLLLGFLVRLDKVTHVHDVLSGVGASLNTMLACTRLTKQHGISRDIADLPSTLVRRAKLELSKEVGSNTLVALKLRNSSASIELDGIVLDPRATKEYTGQRRVKIYKRVVVLDRKLTSSCCCCFRSRVDEPWRGGFVRLPIRC